MKEKKTIIPLLFALFHTIVSIFNDVLIFEVQGRGGGGVIPYNKLWFWLCKVLLFCIVFFSWQTILAKRYKAKYLKFFLIYFLVMMILFVCVYPGIWRWDDLILFGSVTDGYLYYWQHWITSVFYYLCMSIFPCPAGVVFILITIISLIIGWLIGNMYDFIGRYAYLVYIPLLLPSVIGFNFFPLRASMCAYLELLLIFKLLFIALNKGKIEKLKCLRIMLMTAILSVWRPENGIYILIVALFYFFIIKLPMIQVTYMTLIGIGLMIVLMQVQGSGLKKENWTSSTGELMSQRELYSLSGFVTPLGELIKLANQDKTHQAELEEINECISVEMVCNSDGLNAFWSGGLKSINKNQLQMLKKNYIKLILSNFPEFLKERMKLFFYTNGYQRGGGIDTMSAHIYDENLSALPENVASVYTEFRERYLFNRAIHAEWRKKNVSALEMKKTSDYNLSSTGLNIIFYNCSLPVIWICVIWILSAIKRTWHLFTLLCGTAIKFTIVIASAPMAAFMYYFSTYLICIVFAVFVTLYSVTEKKQKSIQEVKNEH